MPKLNTITTATAKDNGVGVAVSAAEASHPTKLISATTIIPCQNLKIDELLLDAIEFRHEGKDTSKPGAAP